MRTWKSSIMVSGAETGGWLPRFVPLTSASRWAFTLQQPTGLVLTPAPLKAAPTNVPDAAPYLPIPCTPSYGQMLVARNLRTNRPVSFPDQQSQALASWSHPRSRRHCADWRKQ